MIYAARLNGRVMVAPIRAQNPIGAGSSTICNRLILSASSDICGSHPPRLRGLGRVDMDKSFWTFPSDGAPLSIFLTIFCRTGSCLTLLLILGLCNTAHRKFQPSSPNSLTRAGFSPSTYSSTPPALSMERSTLVLTFMRNVRPSALE